MGNIKNFNFNKIDLLLSDSDYWDFFLATDEGPELPCTGVTSGDCFVVWYDFSNTNIFPNNDSTDNNIYSLVTWNGATNTGYTLNTIGLTGIDNGLITFDKVSGDTSNLALLSAITGTTLVIPSGDTRLHLTRVTGTTGEYVYPMEYIVDPTPLGNFITLCGGFYQGYYKLDGNSYEVLPVRVNQAWSAEFWLNPSDNCSGTTATTLNDVYPNNKGFFFYMGTRSENKYWNQFYGADTGCTSGCTTPSGCTDIVSNFCTIPKEIDVSIIGDYGVAIPLDPPQIQIDIVTNPFLIYGRARDASHNTISGDVGTFLYDDTTEISVSGGCNVCDFCGGSHDGLGTKTVCNYDGKGIVVTNISSEVSNFTNPFLIYGRAVNSSGCTCNSCSGPNDDLGDQTICSFSGRTSPIVELDYNIDIIDNALGFRIKDDGSIGYRLLTVTGSCYTASTGERLYQSGVTIQEEYSVSGVVSADTWSYIAIRFVTNYLDDCELTYKKPRKGKLMFYVNSRLKFVVDEFDELVARRLNEYKSKQVGVPFNFSLGGGSQGLVESQTFDGLDMADRNLPIEQNFAGTFIGSISQFKFNICDLTFCDIQHNYVMDASRYSVVDTNLILQENGFYLLQEDDFGIEL
jgi:hypothetical protein